MGVRERHEIEKGRKRETRLRERNERKSVTEKKKKENEGKNYVAGEGSRGENEGGEGSRVHYITYGAVGSLFPLFFCYKHL